MAKIQRFIIVDDDAINNSICRFVIKKVSDDIDILDFTFPKEAIEFLEDKDNLMKDGRTVLFLDLNMPLISGWDFLDRFETMPAEIKNHYEIYIVSSSVDYTDIERAHANPIVKDYLIKPIIRESIKNILVNPTITFL